MVSKRRQPVTWADDLFSQDPGSFVPHDLSRLSWPRQGRFPVNHAAANVRNVLIGDLTGSDAPLLIAGYSSIAALVDFVACWRQARGPCPGTVRLLLGSEPFPSQRAHFMSAQERFTEEVRGYWLEHSVSIRLSAKVIRTIAELDAGSLEVRVIPGLARLHAKIYVGQTAATVGSSNYTDFGLARQLEANARFDKAADPERYRELATVAGNYWSSGVSWEDEFRRLLESLLRVVSWQEALARACAELLEGDWAQHALAGQQDQARLWPSQRAGIAQALWVMENLGSVLVADATGSGKTRMGAHLVAAVRDRLLDTGRLRRDRDITTLVCPPGVLDTWRREALMSGVPMMPVSHGVLSRPDPDGSRIELAHVARAQVLAVDEAHNFLSADSNRTRHIRDSVADHVLLFTATPISRGAQDLLSLVSLLGADNFDDETLEILEQLDRGARPGEAMTDQQRQRLRQEIQRFTVRRTKSALNDLVARDPESYLDTASGRVCRYPRHEPRVYDTGESPSDEAVADDIRARTGSLLGVVQLGRRIRMPALFRGDIADQQWLEMRLNAARGLARYQVLAALRSSRAALAEHIAGTETALRTYDLPPSAKTQPSGNVVARASELAELGSPQIDLDCPVPQWLADAEARRAACLNEAATYQQILGCAATISDARERAKAAQVEQLAAMHRLVLAFDRHPITLAAIDRQIRPAGPTVLIATGETSRSRRDVEKLFARDSQAKAIALCSDALNEGLNLQGAAALVHLDLPTTLRVAEQRVGRVDRMDNLHDAITVMYPRDGRAFAAREAEVLTARRDASEALLGSNLPLPAFGSRQDDTIISVERQIHDFEHPDLTWDGIRDAFDPVRRLVNGERAIIPEEVWRLEERDFEHVRIDSGGFGGLAHPVQIYAVPVRSPGRNGAVGVDQVVQTSLSARSASCVRTSGLFRLGWMAVLAGDLVW
jgi:hypothetical protein